MMFEKGLLRFNDTHFSVLKFHLNFKEFDNNIRNHLRDKINKGLCQISEL